MKPKPTLSSCLLIAALAVGSAYGQDDLSSTDSRYPALQEAVDTYITVRTRQNKVFPESAYMSVHRLNRGVCLSQLVASHFKTDSRSAGTRYGRSAASPKASPAC